jgi:peptidyl-prolyl cis-trans isomerase C
VPLPTMCVLPGPKYTAGPRGRAGARTWKGSECRVNALVAAGDRRPEEFRYHLLRAALGLFKRSPSGLDADQLVQARNQAATTFDLEAMVLAAPEAGGLIIPSQQLDEAVAEVAGRYPDADAFAEDLADNGLDEAVLRHALRREFLFDAVMQRVGARRPAVSDLDERLFYELHRERFTYPERRTARHILITVNEDFAENHRAAARARIEQLASRLGGRPHRFGGLAGRYSECPTALEDGRLGTVIRGQLYPELDAALFGLGEGEVSGVVSSELGFHLLLCEKIHRGHTVPFSKARGQIRQLLEERRRRDCQKAWLAKLRESATV